MDPLGNDGRNKNRGISSDFESLQGRYYYHPKQLLSSTSVVSTYRLFRTGNNALFQPSSLPNCRLSLGFVSFLEQVSSLAFNFPKLTVFS